MAEFCKQCSATFLDLDATDFAELCGKGCSIFVLCEGCGPTCVDSEGVCISPDCLERHGAHICKECGCSCSVCEKSHVIRSETVGHHTQACNDRYYCEMMRDIAKGEPEIMMTFGHTRPDPNLTSNFLDQVAAAFYPTKNPCPKCGCTCDICFNGHSKGSHTRECIGKIFDSVPESERQG